MENFFTIKQVAFILKVHQLTVRRHIREKKLAAIKVGGAVRIKEEDFTKFQREYTARKSTPLNVQKTTEAKTFSLNDPFWQLNGSGMSLGS